MTTNGTSRIRLSTPYQFEHLTPGQPFVMVVTRIETGMVLRPLKEGSEPQELFAVRVWLAAGGETGGRPYIDWTHHTLVDVLPVMFNLGATPGRIQLTRTGTGRATKYSVELLANGQ